MTTFGFLFTPTTSRFRPLHGTTPQPGDVIKVSHKSGIYHAPPQYYILAANCNGQLFGQPVQPIDTNDKTVQIACTKKSFWA